MAISIVLLHNYLENFQKSHPDGVVEPIEDRSDSFRFTFAKGRVVDTYERNGRDDSDFYAVYKADDGSFKEIMYATTRGYTYDNGASIDCTVELRNEYVDKLNKENQARIDLFYKIREDKINEACVKANITREQYNTLRSLYNVPYTNAILKLLSSKLRSPYRISLANQVRAWLENPADQRYRYPLSPKQINYL